MPVAFRVMLAVGLVLCPAIGANAQGVVEAVDPPVRKIYHTQVIDLTPAYNQPTALPAYGKAMFYNPGVMETVLENRLEMGVVDHCHECVGYVAMLRAGDLNRRVWIQLSDSTVEGPFQVIDAADQKHVQMLIKKMWVIDVDYETAMRWKMAGPRLITLWDEPPLSYSLSNNIALEESDYAVDIYRHEKLDYYNQSHEYSGHIDTLYVQ